MRDRKVPPERPFLSHVRKPAHRLVRLECPLALGPFRSALAFKAWRPRIVRMKRFTWSKSAPNSGRLVAEVRVVEARSERVWSPRVGEPENLADDGEHGTAVPEASEANAWLIGDDDEVIVIDPGEDADSVLGRVGDREILAVICTHGHAAHVAAAVEVAERDEAPVALHRSDRLLWRTAHGGA